MSKKITLLFILLFAGKQGFSQAFDSTAAIIFTNVVKVDSASQDELYKRAINWFNSIMKDSKSVFNIQDRENGQIRASLAFGYQQKALSDLMGSVANGRVEYTITILLKDGRYKYEITEFTHYGTTQVTDHGTKNYDFGLVTYQRECPRQFGGIKSWREKLWKDIQSQTIENGSAVELSLKDGMTKPSNLLKEGW